jgi:hypothetical protein
MLQDVDGGYLKVISGKLQMIGFKSSNSLPLSAFNCASDMNSYSQLLGAAHQQDMSTQLYMFKPAHI